MVVDYTVDGGAFIPGRPRLWSGKQLFFTGTAHMDLAPDGKRFAVLSLPEAEPGNERLGPRHHAPELLRRTEAPHPGERQVRILACGCSFSARFLLIQREALAE